MDRRTPRAHSAAAVMLLAGALTLLSAGCRDGASTKTSPPSSASALQPNAVVEYVIDGDTVDVLIGEQQERVRLIGIDTPETKKPDVPIQCFGPEATAFTTSLLPPGTPIRLERDVEARDDYGRLLTYVFRTSDGLFVNLEIVRQGFARPLTFRPNDHYAPQIIEAARHAERADLGLWKACKG